MNLTKVVIKNFRSISEYTLMIDKNLQILVGVNEAGKSNIIKALSLLNPKIELSKNDIRDPLPDEANIDQSHVRFVFQMNIDELREIEDKVKLKVLSKAKSQNLLTIGENETTLSGFIKHKAEAFYNVNLMKPGRVSMHWALSGPKYRILPDWKKVAGGKNQTLTVGKETVSLSEYEIVNVKDFPEVEPANLEDLDIIKLNTFIGSHFTEQVTKNLPKCISWSYKESLLLPGKVDLTEFRASPNTCLPLKIMFNLAGIDEVTKAIADAEVKTNGIKNLFRRIGEVTTAHLRKVWPEWNKLQVHVSQNGEFIEAGIEDEFNFYSLDRRSDGFKRFFTFLLMMSAQNKTNDICDNLILIDEPEIGLHPSGQNYLRDELIKIAKTNTVIISTHSIFMIDKEQIDRHLIVTKNKEITSVNKVESGNITDEEVVYKALGFSLFEMLRPRNIIFEGWRDKRVFEIYLKGKGSVPVEHKKSVLALGLLHAAGVKDVPRITNMCENMNRHYIVITDADKPATERQKDHDGPGKWLTYRNIPEVHALTTEDFFSKKFVNKAIKEVFQSHQIEKPLIIDETTNSDYIPVIEKHLKELGELQAEPKRILNDIKEYLVENLKFDDLHEDYKKVADLLLHEVLNDES